MELLILLLSSALFGYTSCYNSCWNNCGSQRTGCSCSSYCQYDGNCCSDYYYYCATSSTSPGYNSCWNNCGSHHTGCSCTSYCQYHGNCCSDYYYYCATSSTSPANNTETATGSPWTAVPCGGYLTERRGEFFSPNYPNYYPYDAHCTWTLLAGERQVISLNFTFVDLQSCCDFIHVYDGPTIQSPTLGSVTGNQRASFKSSSRYMTVNFASDGHGNQKGFHAKWAFKHSAVCGGILHGSGFFSSPYYPNYYHDNMYCVWQLMAPAGQTIFLSFQDLDLDSCCSCDHVNVYDGRSTSSRLIDQLCHSNRSHMDFQSSSSYMTVLFKSNYYGAGRGFKAYFSASLDQITGHVDCSSNRMNIAIRNSYLNMLYIDWEELYLDDRSCKASTDNNYVTFNFPLNSCGTKRKTQDGHIIYSNNVQAAQLTSGDITWRDKTFMLSVSCVMERDSSIGILYEGKEIKNATIRAMGWFNTTMAFYQTSSFSNRITKFPYEVTLNQQLYVQAQLAQPDSSLHLFIDSCVASPNHNFSIRTYDLIRNGCKRGSKINIYNNGKHSFVKFSFHAFKFLRTHNYAFLRCHLIICADDDHNSRCRQGCFNRSKRSMSSDHHTEVITLGPVTLKGP